MVAVVVTAAAVVAAAAAVAGKLAPDDGGASETIRKDSASQAPPLSLGRMKPFHIFLVLAGLSAAVFGKIWLGIYVEREFGTHHLFLKHRSTSSFFFRAPSGESDRVDLSMEEELEESLYAEFVESGGGFRRSVYLFF